MAKDSNPIEELNANAKRAVQQAEQTVEQTLNHSRGVLNNYFNFVQQAFSSYPFGGAELGDKIRNYTERNISTAQEFMNKLSHAKDLQDMIRIQTEYMQTQFSVLTEQTKSLTEAFTKAATSSVKMPFRN
jgi:hypothetical protein